MEKYTLEQIINERIREFDELRKESEKFSELVTYDKKYEGLNNHYSVERNELSLYYTYANRFMKKMEILYSRMPWGIMGLNVVRIPESKPVQQEYRKYNNDLLFTINNPEEFKERLHSLSESPLVKALSPSFNTINSLDGKTQLSFTSYGFTYFEHDNFEFNFLGTDYADLEGDSLTAPQILEIFKESTFDSNNFSEYFSERVERNKDKDLSIEISSDYNIIPYVIDKDEEKTREYFDIEKELETKRLVLTKSK